MTELMGQYKHVLDQQQRLAVPFKLRNDMGEKFIICRAPNGDKCLFGYTLADWQVLMEKMNDMPPSRTLTRNQRFIHAYSAKAEPDAQGRIKIPQEFMEFANIEKDVFILGAGRRIEIWAQEEWDSMQAELEASGEDTTFNLAF